MLIREESKIVFTGQRAETINFTRIENPARRYGAACGRLVNCTLAQSGLNVHARSRRIFVLSMRRYEGAASRSFV